MTMAITKTSTSARTGLDTHGSPAPGTPITAAPSAGPLERADAAEQDSEEALDQEAHAEIGEQREERHDSAAGEPGERGAEREGQRIEPVVEMPEARASAGFSSAARICRPSAVRVRRSQAAGDHQRGRRG